MAEKQPEKSKAISIRDQYIGSAMTRINQLQQRGELDIPANYSVGNALNAAWLKLQEVVDRDKRPALDVCTKESIGYALLKMVIQGLNVSKDQGYFIVYGNKLTFQRSYFGTIAVLKRVDPRVDDVVSEPVYGKDKLKYRLDRGKKIITDHEQALENIDDKDIKASYCQIYDKNGTVLASALMTLPEIHQAWRQSKQNPFDDSGKLKPNTTHAKFPGEMVKKTVLNRAAKILINSSDDSSIMGNKTLLKALDEIDEAEADAEIQANANQEVIDIDPEPAQPTSSNGTQTEQPKSPETADPGF